MLPIMKPFKILAFHVEGNAILVQKMKKKVKGIKMLTQLILIPDKSHHVFLLPWYDVDVEGK